jgi:hypothetical protein
MNRIFIIFFFLLTILLVKPVHSQRIYGALSAGMNLSQVDGDEKYGFKHIGLNIGPSVILPLGKQKKFSITMELLFSQLGSYQHSEYTNDTLVDTAQAGYYDGYKLNLTYVQIPVLFHFTDKNIIAAGAGFLYGQLVGVKEWEDYNDGRGMARTESNLQSPYTKSDFQVVADVRIRLWQRLWINARYSYSMFPIRTREFVNPFTHDTWTRKQYNNVITLRLTYIFNEPLPLKGKAKAGATH